MRLMIWFLDLLFGRAMTSARKWLVLHLPPPIAVRLIPALAGGATQDLVNRIKVTQSLHPAARTATANGTGVDTQGFESATIVVHAGAWTDGTHTPSAEDSADNTTFAAVAAADLIGTFTAITAAGGGNKAYEVGYIGSKRYVRVITTVSGATTGAVYGASVVLGHPRQPPV